MPEATPYVDDCEAIIGYQFADKNFCIEAMHAYTGGTLASCVRKNDRLAILGGVVLHEHICRRWYASHGSPERWSFIIQQVASNANLARVGKACRLDSYVKLSPGTMHVSDKTMATVVAASIGAVFMDSNDDRNKAEVAIDLLFDRLFCDHDLLRLN